MTGDGGSRSACLTSCLLALFLMAGVAGADPVEDDADQAIAAFRSGDEEVLTELAARPDPDPWAVADELLGRGELEVVEALARVASGPDTARLLEFLASRRNKPDNPELREAQAFVRGHESWSHPYYWAARVLWGLPD